METTATKSAKKNGKTRTDSKGKTRKEITPPAEPKKEEMHVFFNGPISDGGTSAHDGDERPFWTICVSPDLDAEPKYSYKVWNFEKAAKLAEKIAQDQGVDIISSITSAN